MPKGGDNVLGDSITKEILASIARQVLERQHRYRWAPGEMGRGGEAGDLDRFRGGAEHKEFVAGPCIICPRNKPSRDDHSSGSSSNEPSAPAPSPRRRSRQADPVGADGLRNIFDALGAERAVIEVELVPDLIVNRL